MQNTESPKSASTARTQQVVVVWSRGALLHKLFVTMPESDALHAVVSLMLRASRTEPRA
jgi:hypothetical protein